MSHFSARQVKLISPAAPQKRKADVVVISDDDDFQAPLKKKKTYKLVPQKLDRGTSSAMPPPPPPPSTMPLATLAVGGQPQQRSPAAAATATAMSGVPQSTAPHHVYAPCPQPPLDAYYTNKENVDVVFHKNNGIAYTKDATVCDFTLPAEQMEGTNLIEQAWSMASYMSH